MRCRATFERGRGAVFVELGDDRLEGSFWVLIDRRRGEEEQHVEEVRVRAVKLYSPAESRTVSQPQTWAYRCLPSSGVVKEEDQADGAQTPLLHSISTSGPHAAFSKHLTGLHLTVPELLVRLPFHSIISHGPTISSLARTQPLTPRCVAVQQCDNLVFRPSCLELQPQSKLGASLSKMRPR